MADSKDLLNQLGGNGGGDFTPAETVAIQVTGYVVPGGGLFENATNARILGRRWDNGEKVEVAFRNVAAGRDRPTIAQFQNDDNSSTPVTTAVGGTIVLEAAFPDAKLLPLRDKDSSVLNARWGTRIAADAQHGWAISCLGRVNPPRLIDEQNPAQGYFQTVSIMRDDRTEVVTSLEMLDRTILDSLDSERRDKAQDWYMRPGRVSAYVRVSAVGESPDKPGRSRLVTLNCDYHTPPGSSWSVPKTRAMVEKDLALDASWQARRKTVEEALNNPAYLVEVIPGAQLYVGRKTVQASMAGKPSGSRVNGVEVFDGERNLPLFSKLVLGIRPSPKTQQPQVLFAAPHMKIQVASQTGRPNMDDLARLNEALSQDSQKYSRSERANNAAEQAVQQAATPAPNPAPIEQRATPQANAPAREAAASSTAVVSAEQVSQESSVNIGQEDDKLHIHRANADGSTLTIVAQSAKQATFLAQLAPMVKANYDHATKSIQVAAGSLPTVMLAAQKQQIGLFIVPQEEVLPAPDVAASPAPAAEPDPSPAPMEAMPASPPLSLDVPDLIEPIHTPAPQALTENQRSQPSPASTSAQEDPGFDLGSLDLGEIDLDSALSQAYSHDAQQDR